MHAFIYNIVRTYMNRDILSNDQIYEIRELKMNIIVIWGQIKYECSYS